MRTKRGVEILEDIIVDESLTGNFDLMLRKALACLMWRLVICALVSESVIETEHGGSEAGSKR